jgi:hypothetical protein
MPKPSNCGWSAQPTMPKPSNRGWSTQPTGFGAFFAQVLEMLGEKKE